MTKFSGNRKEAVFMLGLPASGKSTYIKENYDDTYQMVSADEIRLKHKDYDPIHPDLIHEECVALAEQEMYRLASLNTNIVMDGGSINNTYTLRIITKLKSMFDYSIKVVYINTPTRICIARNNDRIINSERFVPKSAIIDKSNMLTKCAYNLSAIADKFITVDYFSNKNIFVDMDGCVAAYQDLPVDEYGNVDMVGNEIFKYSLPVWDIIDRLRVNFKPENIFILSASPNSICNDEKREWLKINLPFLKDENIFFVGNKTYKTVMLQNLIKKFKFEAKDVLLLDDEHKILEDGKKLNINVMHPSLFLAKIPEHSVTITNN